jgi:hypothetical protein
MDDHLAALTEEEATPRRWRWPFTWLGLLAVGWVVYELTAQPVLGAITVCLKFGWEDFQTAHWLRRRDPDVSRGRTCGWLYFASGLWKIAIVALLMSIAFGAITDGGRGAALPNPGGVYLGTLLTSVLGLGLSALATWHAVELAYRSHTRLWLDYAVHRARRRSVWPPSVLCDGRSNRVGRLLLTTLIVTVAFLLGMTLALMAALHTGQFGPLDACLLSVACLLVTSSPLIILFCRDLLIRWVQAASPYDCWGEDEEPAVAGKVGCHAESF